MQKLEKMRPSRSSEVNSPVISLSACCARRSSSASSSPARRQQLGFALLQMVRRLFRGLQVTAAGEEAAFHIGIEAHALLEVVT